MQTRFTRAALVIAAGLLGCANLVAFAQTSARRSEIENKSARWKEVKAQSKRVSEHMFGAVAADARFDIEQMRKVMAEAWGWCEGLETMERKREVFLLNIIEGQFSEKKISQDERLRKSESVSKLIQLRMLYIYGNLVPNILDQFCDIDGVTGRAWAGPEWQIHLGKEDFETISKEYKAPLGIAKVLLESQFLP